MSDWNPMGEGLLSSVFSVLSLTLDFVDTGFTALIQKGTTPISYQELMENPLLRFYFSESYKAHAPGLVPVHPHDAESFLTAFNQGKMRNTNFSVKISECAASMTFKELQEPFFTYTYHAVDASFHRNIPTDVISLGKGYFLQDTTIWKIPSKMHTPIFDQEHIQGLAILELVQQCQHPLIQQGPMQPEPGTQLITLSGVLKNTKKELLITVTEVLPRSAWQPLAGLSDYVLYKNRVYPVIPQTFLQKYFPQGNQCAVKDEAIPYLAEMYGEVLHKFGDKTLYNQVCASNIFLKKNFSLVLLLTAQVERGVGTAYAMPVLKYGKKYISAKAVSEQMVEAQYIRVDNKWIRKQDLEDIGLGPLGYLIGGRPIASITLQTHEVLRRGSAELKGFWSDCQCEENLWVHDANRDTFFRSHLDFLRKYGISGGFLAHNTMQAAELLADYVRYLEPQLEDGKVLLLMQETYYNECFKKALSSLPVEQTKEGFSIFSSRFKGIGICYYERLSRLPAAYSNWDILFLVKPEEFMLNNQKEYYDRITRINTRLRLGIIFNTAYLFPDSGVNRLRDLFYLQQKNLLGYTKYLFRGPGTSLHLPEPYAFCPEPILKPPVPFAGAPVSDFKPGEEIRIFGGSRFIIRSNIKQVRTQEFIVEQAYFSKEGQPVPTADYVISHETDLAFSALHEKQRDFFLYWRTQFRKGNILNVPKNYIYLYTKELIQVMGSGKPIEYFRELLRLWRSYRDRYPILDNHFPWWLKDFAVLYYITDEALPELFPYAKDDTRAIFSNLYIHKYYIEEDHPLVFEDIRDIMEYDAHENGARSGQKETVSMQSKYSPRLQTAIKLALHGIDRYLRKTLGKKFFAFFYPSYANSYITDGFDPLPIPGNASYISEDIDFYNHEPLRDFLKTTTAYIEHRIENIGTEPCIDPLWKYIIDAELGFAGPKVPGASKTIILAKDALDQLRVESDAVRDLLRTEEEAPQSGPVVQIEEWDQAAAEQGFMEISAQKNPSLSVFLAALEPAAQETLAVIAKRDSGSCENLRKALQKLALEHRTMPEMLFDSINERFHEDFNDLLIDTMDEIPIISAEYEEAVKQYFYSIKGI